MVTRPAPAGYECPAQLQNIKYLEYEVVVTEFATIVVLREWTVGGQGQRFRLESEDFRGVVETWLGQTSWYRCDLCDERFYNWRDASDHLTDEEGSPRL
jgi:hypothetical protein